MGTAGPGRSHKCGPVHHRLGLGPRAQAGQGGGRHGKTPPGLGSGSGLGTNGLLPLRRDPGPVTLPRVGRLRLSLTPGRISGSRGQGPGRTNLGSGKPRAHARIQNPSGAPPRPRITRSEPGDCGIIRPASQMSWPAIIKGPHTGHGPSRHTTGARFAETLVPTAPTHHGVVICITPSLKAPPVSRQT
jgi:hypothetical protein